MSFDENAQTMNVGNDDWLEASKSLQIRGYLPPAESVVITGSPATPILQDDSNPHHREDFDRLLGGMARSSE